MRIGALEGGGTKMVLAVCNENGEVLDRVSIPTDWIVYPFQQRHQKLQCRR